MTVQLNGKFNDEYLRNERHNQGTALRIPYGVTNFMNFGTLTPKK